MEVENNLKTYFENQINKIERNIDVEEAVMSKIAAPRKRTVPTKVLSFAVVLILCIAGTGIVYGQEIVDYLNGDFMNDHGQVEWTAITSDEDRTYSETATEILDNLDIEEGKAVAVYQKVSDYQDYIVCLMKPLTVLDLDLINNYSINSLNLEFDKEILGKYHFGNGKVTYEIISPDNMSMKEEADATGKDVIIKYVDVNTDIIQSIACEYFVKGDTDPYFTVFISVWGGDEIVYYENTDDVDSIKNNDKVMIAGSEVLYEDLIDSKEVTWIYNEHHFSINSTHADMTKEELLQIAEQIKQKY